MTIAEEQGFPSIELVLSMSPSLSNHESSLLLTLEEISQLVSHSHHPGETLGNIVRLIQGRFHTDVCSVYLLEPARSELVLGATVGLKQESVGRVRMRLQEGLTGLVAEKMTPVMVSDAFVHPRFKFFPEAGEDPYHSFLGVPLIESGSLQGVLVVQTREQRTFSANETRLLVAVGAQVAPLVGEAQFIEQVMAVAHEAPAASAGFQQAAELTTFQGASLSPGVGLGQAYLVNGFAVWQQTVEPQALDVEGEQIRLAAAMAGAREEITRLSQRISALVGEDHGAILQGQLMIMQDATIEDDLTAILKAGGSAEGALRQTLDKYVGAFQKLANPFFQERLYDIKDVFRRIIWHLRPRQESETAGTDKLILVAHEASVMDLFSVDLDRLAGVVVEHGGPQSHAAILARSLGIPMAGQVAEVVHRIRPGRTVRVDGTLGRVYLDAVPDLTAVASPRTSAALTRKAPAQAAIGQGLPRLEANINLLCEVDQALQAGTSGVGLYRSEFLFLARRTLPTEDEQVGIYRKLLHLLGGRPVSIRTFDLRPDKILTYEHLWSAASHPLDWRLVLDSPPLQKLFKDQVRAILRAAVVGPARILVPLVSRTELLDFVLDTVAETHEELRSEGLNFAPRVPVGIMIEVAAATAMVEDWARRVDFFSLGTNDLIGSALGIDREDPVGARRDDNLHPGLLRIIHNVVETAHRANRQVTVCGEMAGDSEGAVALSALQVDSLSVAVQQLPSVREVLCRQSAEPLRHLTAELLSLRTAREARELLRPFTKITE
jgi:phosphotransferase system enzyme I (PtsP)